MLVHKMKKMKMEEEREYRITNFHYSAKTVTTKWLHTHYTIIPSGYNC